MNTEHRPDVDIEEDIARIVHSYSPLQMSRSYFTYTVLDGVVTFRGNIRTQQAKGVLLENTTKLPGVLRVESALLRDDEDVRGAVGAILPDDVLATVHGGVVALASQGADATVMGEVMRKISTLPGVRRVGKAAEEPVSGI